LLQTGELTHIRLTIFAVTLAIGVAISGHRYVEAVKFAPNPEWVTAQRINGHPNEVGAAI